MARKTEPVVEEPVTTSVIEIHNAGKIIHRTIHLPEGGGVVVLTGENEAGKSTCLDAVSELCGRKTALARNYHADTAEITLRTPRGSRTVKIHATQKRPSGKDLNALEIEHIEDKLDISDLVDPGFKDDESNDLARIKTLVQMTGAKIPWDTFLALIPPKVEGCEPISLDKAKTIKDPVPQAAAVQALFHAEKRRYQSLQKEADDERLKAEAAVGELDLNQPHDAQQLQDAYRKALNEQTKLQEQVRAAQEATEAREKARRELAESRGKYTGSTVLDAEARVAVVREDVQRAEKKVADADETVRRIEEQLRDAKHAAQVARLEKKSVDNELQAANNELQAAKDHDQMIADMTGLLEKTLPSPPAEEDLEAAAEAVEIAQAAMDLGVRVRDALANRALATSYAQKASFYAARAESYEQAADATDDLLSKAVDVPGFRVVGGQRLLYDDGERQEMFQVLSKGKRTIEAVKVGAMSVSAKGSGTKLLRLDQDLWQDLDPHHRDMVNDICRSEGITVLTAECAAGPLREVIYGQPDSYVAA